MQTHENAHFIDAQVIHYSLLTRHSLPCIFTSAIHYELFIMCGRALFSRHLIGDKERVFGGGRSVLSPEFSLVRKACASDLFFQTCTGTRQLRRTSS